MNRIRPNTVAIQVMAEAPPRVLDGSNGEEPGMPPDTRFIVFTNGLNSYLCPELEIRQVSAEFVEGAIMMMSGIVSSIDLKELKEGGKLTVRGNILMLLFLLRPTRRQSVWGATRAIELEFHRSALYSQLKLSLDLKH